MYIHVHILGAREGFKRGLCLPLPLKRLERVSRLECTYM